METKKVYIISVDKKYAGELILDDTDKSPSGRWNIPANCTEIEPPTEKEGFNVVWNGASWKYTEVPKEPIEPEPTAEELLEQEATETKSKLMEQKDNLLMAMLTGTDTTPIIANYAVMLTAVDDSVAEKIPEVFPAWDGSGKAYKTGNRVQYNGVLYKVLQGHTSQSIWTPSDAPSLFAKVLTSTDGTPSEWQQPDSTNAYKIGDRVIYNGKIYESTIDNNVWSPEAYPSGWQEIEE